MASGPVRVGVAVEGALRGFEAEAKVARLQSLHGQHLREQVTLEVRNYVRVVATAFFLLW